MHLLEQLQFKKKSDNTNILVLARIQTAGFLYLAGGNAKWYSYSGKQNHHHTFTMHSTVLVLGFYLEK